MRCSDRLPNRPAHVRERDLSEDRPGRDASARCSRGPAASRKPPAEASWPWLNLILSGGVSLAAGRRGDPRRMFALELTQMAQRVPELEAAIAEPEADPRKISAAA